MAQFKYIARDRQGKEVSGIAYAVDQADLRKTLRNNELFLTEVKGGAGGATAQAPTGTHAREGSGRITREDMVIAIRQLATMTRAGLPIMNVLDTIAAQTTKTRFRIVLKEIEDLVTEGRTLSSSMRQYPHIFSPLLCALVEAGERTGTLAETLEVAAHHLEREMVLAAKVKTATLYPKLVVGACFGVIALMMTLVVPTFASVYRSFHAALPTPTLVLMAISDAFVRYWWLVAALILAMWLLYRWYSNTPEGKKHLDSIALRTPFLGPLARKVAIARLVQTLSGALRGGVPVLSALAISAPTAGNVVIRDAVIDCAQSVREGSPMAFELERTGQFPIMVTRMVKAGETAGNLDEMLTEVSRFYERDVEFAVDRLARLIEPVMTLLIGGIVLFVLIGLYSPVFSLGRAVTGQH